MENEDNIYDEIKPLIAVYPDKIQCESKERILFIFNKPLLVEDGPYEVEFKGEHRCLGVPAIRVNSYTIQAYAPAYYPPEKVTVSIHNNTEQLGASLGERSFEFLSNTEMLEKFLEKVTDPENLLCEVFGISMADMSIFDEALANKMQHKFPNGFHLINEQILEGFIGGGQSSTAYPTFLHFGAARGLLHTVTTCLKICPAALRACALTNKDGKRPREIAQENGHHLLSEELRLFESQREKKNSEDDGDEEDAYMIMNPAKDKDEEEDQYEYLAVSPRSPNANDDDFRLSQDPELWRAVSIAEKAVNASVRMGCVTEEIAKSFSKLLHSAVRQKNCVSSPPCSPRAQFLPIAQHLDSVFEVAPALPPRLYMEKKRHSIHDIPQNAPPLPPRSPRPISPRPQLSPRSPTLSKFFSGTPLVENGRTGSMPNITYDSPCRIERYGSREELTESSLAGDQRPPPTNSSPSVPFLRACKALHIDALGLSPRLPPRRPILKPRNRSMSCDPQAKAPGQRQRTLSQPDEYGYVTIASK